MKKYIPLLCISLAVVGAIVACTGDDPAAGGPIAQGELGGDCFVNSTCKPGLECTTIDGTAKCANPTNTTTSSSSSSSSGTSGTPVTDSGGDTGARCTFSPTPFVCKAATRCYGEPLDAGSDAAADAGEDADAADAGADADANADAGPPPDCIAQGATCDPGQLKWECNSGHYCGSKTCCITATIALDNRVCNEGNLTLIDGGGSVCAATQDVCPTGATRLCQVNADCEPGSYCSPVRIFGNDAIKGTIVGACARPK